MKIIESKSIKACGLSVEITKSHSENFSIISKHWQFFNRELNRNKIKLPVDWIKYGITFRKNEGLFYMCAIPEMPDTSFQSMLISHGYYCQFQHVGAINFLKSTINDIYKNLLPINYIELDTKMELVHYERYDNRFHWSRKDSIIDILIPIIKPKNFQK